MMQLNFERLVVEQEPRLIRFSSEPYPILLKTGFSVAANVIISRGSSKVEKSLIISPRSLGVPLFERMKENQGLLAGIEVWIYKSGPEKTASYVVENR